MSGARARGVALRHVVGLTLGVAPLLSVATSAQTFGPYDWTLVGNPVGSGTISAETMHVTGPDFGGWGWCDGGAAEHATWFETVSPYPAHVSCDVHFVLFNVDPSYDYPVALVDGVVVAECHYCYDWVYDLHFEFDVEAGASIGLGVWSLDCIYGPGIADFTNLTVEPKTWDDLGGGIDPQTSWSVAGPAPGAIFARSLDGLPDVDGDGRGDLVVGAPGSAVGKVRILSGADGQVLTLIDGPETLGMDVASAGDVNGDGLPEIVAGAPQDGFTNNGLLSVHEAHAGALLFTQAGSLKGHLGTTVDGAGDVNGDGLADVIGGAEQPHLGTVYVLAGPSGDLLHEISKTSGIFPTDKEFGADVAGAGDVDLDGTPDILIGAPGVTTAGHAYVYSGATAEPILDITGAEVGFAASVAAAGDVNGDGHVDLLVAHPADLFVATSVGRVEVRSGLDGSLLLAFDGTAEERIGNDIDGGRDVNLDGTPDIAFMVQTGEQEFSAHVHSGSDGALLHELYPKIVLVPYAFNSETSLALVPDMDLDGTSDLVVGTPSEASATGRLWTFDDLQATGTPVLQGTGELQADALVSLSIHGAPAGACGLLLVGSSAVKLPALGGILVPQPAVTIPVCVDASGSLVLSERWPAGLPQWTTVWMQAWLPDVDAQQGWIASNGLSATQLGP